MHFFFKGQYVSELCDYTGGTIVLFAKFLYEFRWKLKCGYVLITACKYRSVNIKINKVEFDIINNNLLFTLHFD